MRLSVNFRTIQCSCGLTYAIPEKWAKDKEEDHSYFYCPNCREPRYYPQESREQKYRRLYNEKKACSSRLQKKATHLERKFWGLQGHVAKLKKQKGNSSAGPVLEKGGQNP